MLHIHKNKCSVLLLYCKILSVDTFYHKHSAETSIVVQNVIQNNLYSQGFNSIMKVEHSKNGKSQNWTNKTKWLNHDKNGLDRLTIKIDDQTKIQGA